MWAAGLTLLEFANIRNPWNEKSLPFAKRIETWDIAYFRQTLASIQELKNPRGGSLLELIKKMLVIDSQKRLTVEEALQSSYVKTVPNLSEEELYHQFS